MEKRKDFSLRMLLPRTVVLGFLVACGNGTAPTKSAADPQASEPSGAHSHSQQGHHHRFDDAARWSKVFDDPARDAWQRPTRVVELMAITPNMTVADVGAGTGYFEPHLSRAVGPQGKVIAEDVEPDMIKWLAERAKKEGLSNVEAVLGGASDPKLAPGAVDRILIVDTWHHIDDRSAFAKSLALALKSTGAIFVVDFTMDSPHGPPRAARLTPETVIHELDAAGLRGHVLKEASLPHQYVVRAVLASASIPTTTVTQASESTPASDKIAWQ